MDVDFRLHHVDAGGISTRVLQAGSGPALVMLNGSSGHLERYARNVRDLAKHFHVLCFDMVGHGYTDKPDMPYLAGLRRACPQPLGRPRDRPGVAVRGVARVPGSPDEIRLLADWIPDAEFILVEGAAHWPQWEKPEEVLQLHLDFLGKRPTSPARRRPRPLRSHSLAGSGRPRAVSGRRSVEPRRARRLSR